jgi:hypothetical protein
VVPKAAAETAVSLDPTGITLSASDQYMVVSSSAMTALPGDVVLFTIERPGSGGDGYSGEVHVIKQTGVITGTT